MTLDFMSLKATSTAALRAEKQKEKTLEHEKAQAAEKVKLLSRELNPFWKDNGTGLPPEEGNVASCVKVQAVEDGGLSWLKKSYQRMKEQSERENRKLEEIVAERYGSMENFQKKLEEAEKSSSKNSNDDTRDRWRKSRYGDEFGRFSRPNKYEDNERRETLYNEQNRYEKTSCKESPQYSKYSPRVEGLSRNRTESKLKRYFVKPSDEAFDPKRSQDRSSSSKPKHPFLKPSEEDDDKSLNIHEYKRQKDKMSNEEDTPKNSSQKSSSGREISWKKSSFKDCKEEKQQSKGEDFPPQDSKIPRERTDRIPSPGELESTRPESPRPDQELSPVKTLTEDEMNKLGAKIVKAEMLGNLDLASKLRAQMEEARKQKESRPCLSQPVNERRSDSQGSGKKEDHEVLLVRTDQSGRAWPVNSTSDPLEPKGGRRKRPTIPTHDDKERVRYFHDDDNQSLQDLVKREKMGTSEDQNKLFLRMASKFMEKTDRDYYTLDDMFVSKAAVKEHANEEEERERRQAMHEHRKLAAQMEKCPFCFDNAELPKHLIVAIGTKVYLCLPNRVSLTEGHCLIVPLQHHTATTLLDEDIYNEIQVFRKALVKMFEARGLDCVFLESNIYAKKRFHLVYECIPLPKEIGDMAPLYFKKGILECEEEWSMNKKLIDLSTKDIRRSVPKGLPYFSVDFGLQGGYAHVIEDEHKFPAYFGKEIIGGMMDLEPRIWRKGIRENFEDQRKKVLQFAEWWKPFDITKE
ncbi:hypothetical protein GDO86_004675 [Hymenochirus boettgeri]|uniref:CWF19-like protein 2 n=1 Tax=Hymenochirus boettgeri TaxID=247094 RepID=A0A8T2KC44_9PIPI|nr:hypothetical protein GDO86_004675 [Hymenochirus boettgeri]